MAELRRTPLYDRHVNLGAKMVEFGGWEMPLNYAGGIFEEHLATRRGAGLFDVSHMGRFVVRGAGAPAFLQHALTNNAAALDVGRAQYTMVPDPAGGAVDDAYLYRFVEEEHLLVVNAANRAKDWDHFQSLLRGFPGAEMIDRSEELAMISLQGPRSREIMEGVLADPALPEPKRNALGAGSIQGARVLIGRTGYTGEPLCFELFVPRADAPRIWDLLCAGGAAPVGLGARDTLRLEAGLPLYGHELGTDPEGRTIPIFACPLAKFAVSFSPLKGDFVGRAPLERQYAACRRIAGGGAPAPAAPAGATSDLPRIIRPVAILGKAVARAGAKVFVSVGGKQVGWVTSGTAVPYWKWQGEGLASRLTDEKGMRSIALALLDSDLRPGDRLSVDVRGRAVSAEIVPCHLNSKTPPCARPVLCESSVSE